MVALSESFVRIYVDCTGSGPDLRASDAARPWMDRYEVRGWPTVIFLDGAGNEVERFTGCRPAATVRAAMRRVRDAGATDEEKVLRWVRARRAELASDDPAVRERAARALGRVRAALAEPRRVPVEAHATARTGRYTLAFGRVTEEELSVRFTGPTPRRLVLFAGDATVEVEVPPGDPDGWRRLGLPEGFGRPDAFDIR